MGRGFSATLAITLIPVTNLIMTSTATDADWQAVSLHLQLVNMVRARIGQRALPPHAPGYTPADIKADAAFYASSWSWVRQRAQEMGLG